MLVSQAFMIYQLSEKYFFQFFIVKGPSMLPTLESESLLILDSFTTTFIRKPRRNEVISARNPFKRDYNIVKRVLYLEGEIAEFWNPSSQKLERIKIPPNHIWIEGDNKENSKDSRQIGPVSLHLVNGIVRYQLWPFSHIQRL